MPLRNFDDKQSRKRPPMSRRQTWIWVAVALAIIVFVIVVATVSGKGLF